MAKGKMRKKLINKITLPLIKDDCNLAFAEVKKNIPFEIKRIFYITKAKNGLPRGLHAHHKTKQAIFCIQGSVKIVIDNRKKREEVKLSKLNEGLLMDNLIWYEMHNFKKDTILLVLASEPYDEKDYIRSYSEYRNIVKNKS